MANKSYIVEKPLPTTKKTGRPKKFRQWTLAGVFESLTQSKKRMWRNSYLRFNFL